MVNHIKSLIVGLAFEWQFCSDDPLLFCYRIGWSLLASRASESANYGDSQSWSKP